MFVTDSMFRCLLCWFQLICYYYVRKVVTWIMFNNLYDILEVKYV